MPNVGLHVGVGRRQAGLLPFVPPAGNVITNWAGTGTGGTNGLPGGWIGITVPGVSLSVLSRTPYKGGTIIEFQFNGTATASGGIYITFGGFLAVPVAPGQVWRQQIFAERVGVASPADLCVQAHWRSAAQAYIAASGGTTTPVNGVLSGPALVAPNVTAPANAAWGAYLLFANIASAQVVSLRYKIFAPVMVMVG